MPNAKSWCLPPPSLKRKGNWGVYAHHTLIRDVIRVQGDPEMEGLCATCHRKGQQRKLERQVLFAYMSARAV